MIKDMESNKFIIVSEDGDAAMYSETEVQVFPKN
jgi:hypothetical protein